jgi:hypothetical protein
MQTPGFIFWQEAFHPPVGVFAKYEKHRKLVLDDILASIARLPSTKRSLRTYR